MFEVVKHNNIGCEVWTYRTRILYFWPQSVSRNANLNVVIWHLKYIHVLQNQIPVVLPPINDSFFNQTTKNYLPDQISLLFYGFGQSIFWISQTN